MGFRRGFGQLRAYRRQRFRQEPKSSDQRFRWSIGVGWIGESFLPPVMVSGMIGEIYTMIGEMSMVWCLGAVKEKGPEARGL